MCDVCVCAHCFKSSVVTLAWLWCMWRKLMDLVGEHQNNQYLHLQRKHLLPTHLQWNPRTCFTACWHVACIEHVLLICCFLWNDINASLALEDWRNKQHACTLLLWTNEYLSLVAVWATMQSGTNSKYRHCGRPCGDGITRDWAGCSEEDNHCAEELSCSDQTTLSEHFWQRGLPIDQLGHGKSWRWMRNGFSGSWRWLFWPGQVRWWGQISAWCRTNRGGWTCTLWWWRWWMGQASLGRCKDC